MTVVSPFSDTLHTKFLTECLGLSEVLRYDIDLRRHVKIKQLPLRTTNILKVAERENHKYVHDLHVELSWSIGGDDMPQFFISHSVWPDDKLLFTDIKTPKVAIQLRG